MNKLKVTYAKVYTDDTGKHTQNIFGDYTPSYISYKTLWTGIVEGFYTCTNSDIIIMCTNGNIRIVVSTSKNTREQTFEQYFLSELDGKILNIPSGTTYAIENMNESKSSFLIGTDNEYINFNYTTKNIFDWNRRKA